MSFNLTTSGNIVAKSGTHVSSTLSASGNILSMLSDQAEGYVEALTGKSWVDNYSSLSTGIKNILDDVVSSKAAMGLISMDTTGYIAREADLLMNLNDGIVEAGLRRLKETDSNTLNTP